MSRSASPLRDLPGGRIKSATCIESPELPFGIGTLEIEAGGNRFRFLGTQGEWQMVLDQCRRLVNHTPRVPEGITPPVHRTP